MRFLSIVLGLFAQLLELFFEFVQFLIGKLFKINQLVSRAFHCADDLIKFQMHCLGIAVLRVLNQKHHQKRHYSRAGVNNELPRVREMEGRTG